MTRRATRIEAVIFDCDGALVVLPGRCAVAEDNRFGVEAGINAGMYTFWFRPQGPLPRSVVALHRLADRPDLLAQATTTRA